MAPGAMHTDSQNSPEIISAVIGQPAYPLALPWIYVRYSLSNHILDPKAPRESFTVLLAHYPLFRSQTHNDPWQLHRRLQECIPLNSISSSQFMRQVLIFSRLRKTALHFMCPRHETALTTNPGIKLGWTKGLDICFAPDWYKATPPIRCLLAWPGVLFIKWPNCPASQGSTQQLFIWLWWVRDIVFSVEKKKLIINLVSRDLDIINRASHHLFSLTSVLKSVVVRGTCFWFSADHF